MKLLKLITGLCLLLTAKDIKAQLPLNDPTWTLKVYDEFDSLKTSLWYPQYWATSPINNGDEYNSPSNLLFNHTPGFLSIKCEVPSTPIYYPVPGRLSDYYEYQSGVIYSKTKYKYGYWEISAKFPAGHDGYWPAFWLLGQGPNACTTPPNVGYYNEIDILENGGEASKFYDSFGYNYHWRYPPPACDAHSLFYNNPAYFFPINGNISNENKIGMFWEPGRMTWFFNDVPVRIIDDPTYTPANAMHTIMNFAVDPNWEPDPQTVFPAYLEINWFKLWQLETDCSTAVSFCNNFNAGTYVSKVKQSISIGGSGCSDNINSSSNIHFWATDYVILDEGTSITDNGSGSFSINITNCPN